MLSKFALPLAIVVICSAVAVWMVLQQPAPALEDRAPPVLLVDVVEVEHGSATMQVRANGSVSPRTQTTLVSEVSGQIIEVAPAFVSGGFFEAGDLLVRIDDRNYRAEVKRAEAAVATARRSITQEQGLSDYAKRTEELRNNKAATDLALRKPQLAEAEANLEFALADLEKRRGDLERTVIRAPYDGMIRRKLADVGQFVNPGSELAAVFAIDSVEVRLPLPDRELPFLDLEAQPDVSLESHIGGTVQRWTGRLERTEGIFDEQSRVLYAVVQVDDPYNRRSERWPHPLRIGTFVDAAIDGVEVADVVRLPRSVLKTDDQVWTVGGNNELLPRRVEVLRADEDTVYIVGGLEGVSLVCLTSLENPLPGTIVRYELEDHEGD